MHKELADLTWDELVREGIQLELDAIVQGRDLRSRVFQIMDLAARWNQEKQDRARKTS